MGFLSSLATNMPHLIECRCLVQRVAGDSEEHIEEGVVPAQGEQHEVEGVDASPVPPPPLGVNRGVHHLQWPQSVSGVRSIIINGSGIGDLSVCLPSGPQSYHLPAILTCQWSRHYQAKII